MKPYRPLSPARLIGIAAASGIALAALAGSAAAADPASPVPQVAAGPQFEVTASMYLWATGLEGRMRTLPPLPAVNVNIGFDQVIKNFDGGIMGAGEIRRDRYMLFFDVIASKISPDKALHPAGYPAAVKVTSGSFTGMAAAGYRMLDDPTFVIDGFAGIRGFAMRNKLTVETAPVTLKLSESEQWVDGVVGARLRVNFTPAWHAVAMGFVGGGGSRYLWDVFGGVGYAFNNSITAFAGYRAMKVDYRRGGFVFNALQHGPVLGFQSRF